MLTLVCGGFSIHKNIRNSAQTKDPAKVKRMFIHVQKIERMRTKKSLPLPVTFPYSCFSAYYD